jgi:hypothetical protein
MLWLRQMLVYKFILMKEWHSIHVMAEAEASVDVSIQIYPYRGVAQCPPSKHDEMLRHLARRAVVGKKGEGKA